MNHAANNQSGFTIIELIVVIVILGVLAAVALPRFIDVSDDAKTAAVRGVAGAAGAAMALNYSGCAIKNQSTADTSKCRQVTVCTDVYALMQGGNLPTGYTVTNGAPITSNGTEFTCTVSNSDTTPKTAEFRGIAAGN